MGRVRGAWKQLRALLRKAAVERELEEEVAFHLEMEAAHLERSAGLSPRVARRQAHVSFGGVERYKEGVRDGRWTRRVEDGARELRLAARSLARSPVLTLAAVATLATGVGANTAVFSLVSALLLRPLPFAAPDRLVTVYQRHQPASSAPQALRWSYPEFVALRGSVESFEGLAAYTAEDANFAADGDPVRVRLELVTASYFGILGVAPALGRGFRAEEDGPPGAHPVAVVSHALWQAELGGRADALGLQVRLNGVPLTVIGVMPAGFGGLTGEREVWIPQAMAPQVTFPAQLTTTQQFMSVVGRLGAGVSLAEASAELSAAGARAVAAARPAEAGGEAGSWGIGVVRLDEARRDRSALRARYALAGAVFFVLLIAAVNVTGLLLARAVGRARERAVRTALGAGRARLVREALAESGVIGVLGGAAGVLLAFWLVRGMARLAPARPAGPGYAQLDAFARPEIDFRVALFGMGVAIVAALLAGLVPALRAPATSLAETLKAGARGSTLHVGSLRRPTILSAITVAQLSCALVLLLGAGLLLRTFHSLHTADGGFDADRVLSFRLAAPEAQYGGDRAPALLQRVLEQVTAVPGVVSASVSRCTPFASCSSTWVTLAGRTAPEPELVGRNYVAPDHFRTLGIPLVRGRLLTAEDRAGRPRVAVINEAAARRFWPGEDPLGQRVHFSSGGGFASPDSLTEIVGVVGDVVYGSPGSEPEPDFYTSYLQFSWPATLVLVRAAADPAALVPALRRAVAEVDANLPIYDVSTVTQWRGDALSNERFLTAALSAFAAAGLLLAVIGVYGIMNYSVLQRRREIGIRMALGATSAAVLREVVGQGVALAAGGLLIGGVASFWLVSGLAALVPGLGAVDPLVLAAVAAVLLGATAAAAWLPGRRATRVQPAEVMLE